MKQYKSVTFGCGLNTKKGFNDKLQKLLDEYAASGWHLHSFHVCGESASICIVIFEKD